MLQTTSLQNSLWVDDITISGKFVPGALVREIREAIRSAGLKSHKIQYRTGNRRVVVTGIGIEGLDLRVTDKLNLQIREHYSALFSAQSDTDAENALTRLLGLLGTIRYVSGRSSRIGKNASNQMNSLRQQRTKLNLKTRHQSILSSISSSTEGAEAPWV